MGLALVRFSGCPDFYDLLGTRGSCSVTALPASDGLLGRLAVPTELLYADRQIGQFRAASPGLVAQTPLTARIRPQTPLGEPVKGAGYPRTSTNQFVSCFVNHGRFWVTPFG